MTGHKDMYDEHPTRQQRIDRFERLMLQALMPPCSNFEEIVVRAAVAAALTVFKHDIDEQEKGV